MKMEQVNIKAHHYPFKAMGCGFVITGVHSNPQIVWDAIRAAEDEINRIEDLISSWLENSQTSRINNLAGVAAVKVDRELFELIDRSIKISNLTSGSFDICGTLSREYWNFNNDVGSKISECKIHELRSLIDYRNIVLDPSECSVALRMKGMKIGFGGIGKGYAAGRAMKVMQELGIEHGLINASGDLMCWGNPPNKDEWVVKIPDPINRNSSILEFTLPYGSVVTSGNHENFTIIDDKVYSHIVDPRTGHPVSHIQQVSVVSPDPEFADAMATALSVMTIEEGIGIVNKLKGIECIIIDAKEEMYMSNHFERMLSAAA